MARIRSLKPTFWTDEKIGLLPRDVRLTFLGLISALADDEGRFRASPRIVRGAVYPYDDDLTAADVERHLAALADAGRIVRYRVAGDEFAVIRNWRRHQKIDRPSPSILPPPPEPFDDDSSNVRRPNPAGEEGRGEEGIGEENTTPSPASARATAAERAVMAEAFPRLAEALLPEADGRDVLLELATWAPDKRAYLGACLGALEGMHGFLLTPDELRSALTDWLANGERPNLRRFRGYLRGAKALPARASPELQVLTGRPSRPSNTAVARTLRNGLAAFAEES